MHPCVRISRRLSWWAAGGVLLWMGLLTGPPTSGQDAEANVLLFETFAEGEGALPRWEFRGDEKARLSFVPAHEGAEARAAYVDFRETAAWSLLCRREVRLEAGAQYTLSARVRRNLGYGAIKLVAQTAGAAAPAILAEAEVIKRLNERHELSVIFVAREDAAVRVGFTASGYAEMWIEDVRLRRNVPPLSSYVTGLLLPAASPTAQARRRTGAFLEAEDIAAVEGAVSPDDADGDNLWALCRVNPDGNPWLFSENTVLKSDSLSAEDGGRTPPLKLAAAGLLPGPYQVFLSDPYRDAAISLDGKEWKRVKGSAGEIDLGVVEVEGAFTLWVSHRYRTGGNPGPIYVDYVRLLPVYDAARKLEQPAAPPPAPSSPPVLQTTLRLCGTGDTPRRSEWVMAGIPFARGAFRPTDGLGVEGASSLLARPLVLWSDGSVKWLRVEFRADVGASPDAGRVVRYGRGVPAQRPAGRPAREVKAGYSLKCGRIEVVVGSGLWEKLLLDGKEIVSGAPSARFWTASGLRLDQLLVESAAVENEGPRPTLVIRGHLGAAGKPGPVAFDVRLFETAPQTLGLHFSVVNESDERHQPEKGCAPAVPLTELALILEGIRFAPKDVRWPAGAALPLGDEAQTLLQTGAGACVEEFAGSWQLTRGASTLSSGKTTSGWVDLRGEGRGIAVGVREFLEKCPMSLTVKRSGAGAAVEIGIWPARGNAAMRYAQGTRLSTEIALVLHDGAQPEGETASRLASVLQPLQAVLPPDYSCATGVFGPATPRKDERFSGFRATAEAVFRTLKSRFMSYGIEDWGDFFAPCGYVRTEARLWANMEWDFIATLTSEFVRTGDAGYLQYAHQAGRHFANIDTIHFSSNEKWRGGSHVHTGDTREGHQVEPPDYAHAGWAQGLLWAYYACGDEALREAAIGLAEYVVANLPPEGPHRTDPPFSMWNCSRQAGNPMLTLASVYELVPDPKYLHALNRIVDFTLRVQDPKLGCWSVPFYEEPVYHRPSPHWGAVLERGLYQYWQMTGDRRVVQAFNRLESYFLERHPPETRRDLRPGSSSRTTFVFEAEPIALASLFSKDPGPLLERGLKHLAKAYPPGRVGSLNTRGVPGDLMGGARLAGALAHAKKSGRMALDGTR